MATPLNMELSVSWLAGWLAGCATRRMCIANCQGVRTARAAVHVITVHACDQRPQSGQRAAWQATTSATGSKSDLSFSCSDRAQSRRRYAGCKSLHTSI